ncbi:protein EFR3 homolog B-like [Limulus polyphemus]|uniref:Protein EFR3 homolog B-like n=1 Tax=Limulus polyphemus TaxID=6850 RepID=A0ABM1TH84_LIMPO|nr:protein EFR3 homolog B-like [Limulus polyphemus]
MSHLDEKSRVGDVEQGKPGSRFCADAKVRRGIVIVLSHIVTIAAGESIGPSVLEMFNSLLNHLRNSIDVHSLTNTDQEDEKLFQESVINTLGEFANNLPNYQKIEIMMFIMGKIPQSGEDSRKTDVLLQHILLKSLLEVGTKYRTIQLAQAFPSPFLQPLLDMSLASDPAVRLVVQQILHTLLDRHGNIPKLQKPNIDGPLPPMTVDKCSRQDVMFMKKNGPEIMVHIYENIKLCNNTKENFEALYTTLGLLCIELGSDSDALGELLRLIFAIQDLPNITGIMISSQRASIHALVAAFLYLTGHLTAIPSFCSHIEQVIKNRREKAQQLLPREDEPAVSSPFEISDDFLFDKNVVSEALRSSGHDTSRLLTPFMPRSLAEVNVSRSISDLNSVSVEVDSIASSPGLFRKHPQEEITVESLKKMMAEPLEVRHEEEQMRRLQIVEQFRTSAFEDLVAKTEQQTVDLQNKLNEILGKLPPAVDLCSRPSSPHPTMHNEDCFRQFSPIPPPYPVQFPEMFVF